MVRVDRHDSLKHTSVSKVNAKSVWPRGHREIAQRREPDVTPIDLDTRPRPRVQAHRHHMPGGFEYAPTYRRGLGRLFAAPTQRGLVLHFALGRRLQSGLVSRLDEAGPELQLGLVQNRRNRAPGLGRRR